MFNRNSKARALVAGLLLGLLGQGASALPEDQQQPIHITADSAVQENNTVTYRGHVVVVQGSRRIEADQMVVYHNAGKLQRIVATGNPVHFREQPEAGGSVITGSGATLIYYHTDQRVELLQNALVDRDNSTVKGNRIEYLLPSKTVRAEGANTNQKGQVEMVLQPGQVEQKPQQQQQQPGNPPPEQAPADNPPQPSAPQPAEKR